MKGLKGKGHMQIYFCINILLACVHVVDKKIG